MFAHRTSISARQRISSIRIIENEDHRYDNLIDMDVFKRESELVQDLSSTIPDNLPLAGVHSFVLHVSRWLYRQSIKERSYNIIESDTAEAVAQVVALIVQSQDEITLKTWNSTFDKYSNEPAIWVFVLKAFCWKFEIIPRKSAIKLLAAYGSLGGLSGMLKASANRKSNASPVLSLKEVFVPILEDMPPARHMALASLCTLLQRDRRNRKAVVSAFGPWLLLEHTVVEQEVSMTCMKDCAGTLEILVTTPETLFGAFEMPFENLAEASIGESSYATGTSGGSMLRRHGSKLLRRGSSLRLMLKKITENFERKEIEDKKVGNSHSFSSVSTKAVRSSMEDKAQVSNSDDEEKSFERLRQELRDRPARSRQSLERIYGRAPPPPPPLPSGTEPTATSEAKPSSPQAASSPAAEISEKRKSISPRNATRRSIPRRPPSRTVIIGDGTKRNAGVANNQARDGERPPRPAIPPKPMVLKKASKEWTCACGSRNSGPKLQCESCGANREDKRAAAAKPTTDASSEAAPLLQPTDQQSPASPQVARKAPPIPIQSRPPLPKNKPKLSTTSDKQNAIAITTPERPRSLSKEEKSN